MADLQTWASMAEILGGAAVVGGVLFAVVQMRQSRRQREETAALHLFQAIHGSPDFMRARQRILSVADGATAQEIRAQDPAIEEAAQLVGGAYENLGIMVFRRSLSLAKADEYFGGSARLLFRKLRPLVEEGQRRNPKNFEWWQWLVERLEARTPLERVVGAYAAHREWKP